MFELELKILDDKIMVKDTPMSESEETALKKQIEEQEKGYTVTLVKSQVYIYTPIIQKEL